MSRSARVLALAAVTAACLTVPGMAGIVVYEEGEKKIEIGGRVQMQYLQEDPDGDETTDRMFFRRLRPYVAGTVTEDWMGKIQFDLGKADEDNEVAVKDAYAMWSGLKNHKLYIGNTKTPFSREFNTSSKRLQLIERNFAGGHDYGSPDRQLGFRLNGHTGSKKLAWAAAVGSESHDPDAGKLDFDTPVNPNDDFNEGVVLAGRVDWHPLGYTPFDRTDFRTDEFRFNVSLAAYSWSNDDDNNTLTDPDTGDDLDPNDGKADLDRATGVEISAGVRGHGLSADAEVQKVSAEAVDGDLAEGLYADGESDLDIVSLQGGYLLPGVPVEIVAGWDTIDADGYEEKWKRTSAGVNWYWNKHKAKVQAIYRINTDMNGVRGEDQNEVIVQTQFVF